jgi:NAD(P)-dependent dehydrogenase (short-subunit alcohol dehydrogenase family)
MSRWVLVTGAAKRIGRAIALDLAAAGWDVVVHYNTSRDEAIKTVQDIEALGRRAGLAELDLADLRLVEKLIPALAAELGVIDALVNNAALFEPDANDPGGARHMAINAEAPRILSEAFAKRAPHGGAIVNILDADPSALDFSFYNASKEALAETTHEMAKRFAPRVHVHGIALGPVLRNSRQSEEHFQEMARRSALGKALPVDEIASSVRKLIENESMTDFIIRRAANENSG